MTKINTEYQKLKIESLIPRVLRDLSSYGMFLAGGAITSLFTNKEINDFDIYLKKKEDMLNFLQELRDDSHIISVTDKSVLFKSSDILINVILLDAYETAEDIFRDFDFTCVMGAYDINNKEFILHESFLIDNASKIIKFNTGTKFPIVSALRIKKYEERGYSISKNEYLRILLTCIQLKITNYNELSSHIGGMYGLDIDSILDTTKEFNLSECIEQFSKIYENYDLKNTIMFGDSEKEELFNGLLVSMILKPTDVLLKFKWNDEYYLLINDRVFNMPKYLNNKDIKEVYGGHRVIFYTVRRKEKNGDIKLTYYNNGQPIITGERVRLDVSLKTYEDFGVENLRYDNHYLIVMEFSISDLNGGGYSGTVGTVLEVKTLPIEIVFPINREILDLPIEKVFVKDIDFKKGNAILLDMEAKATNSLFTFVDTQNFNI